MGGAVCVNNWLRIPLGVDRTVMLSLETSRVINFVDGYEIVEAEKAYLFVVFFRVVDFTGFLREKPLRPTH